ncbi:hypothetical protein [Streptomyces europaeiscabiei]|uniref:hypothetical protein n=1 Tax=Streptomyces europaeiscabiei TaxID=146819 RepID=UPI0029AC0632|nr:hypothetical protein [Streptomyces europaeiscabiei]MDX3842037.1 hypothetical protein [Streptomyces europaeiscabiei]
MRLDLLGSEVGPLRGGEERPVAITLGRAETEGEPLTAGVRSDHLDQALDEKREADCLGGQGEVPVSQPVQRGGDPAAETSALRRRAADGCSEQPHSTLAVQLGDLLPSRRDACRARVHEEDHPPSAAVALDLLLRLLDPPVHVDVAVVAGDEPQTAAAVGASVPYQMDDDDTSRCPFVDEPPAQQGLDLALIRIQRPFEGGSQLAKGILDFVQP